MAASDVLSSPILAGTAVILAVYLLVHMLRRKSLRLPPGPTGLPFVGNYFTLAFSKCSQRELLCKWANKYGNVCMFSLFGTRFVLLGDASIVLRVYAEEEIHDRASFPFCNMALDRPNTGLGIVGSDSGPAWKELRKFVVNVFRKVTTATHTGAKFEQLVISQAEKYLQQLSDLNGSNFNPSGSLYVTVANVTSSIVIGKTYEYDDQDFLKLLDLCRDTFVHMATGALSYHVPILNALPSGHGRKLAAITKKTIALFAKFIEQQRDIYDPATNDGEVRSLIEALLKEQHKRKTLGNVWPFDDKNLVQLTWDMCIGGFETVYVSINWLHLLMAQHPDVQAKVQAEMDQVIGRERMPKFSDRFNLPFTMATITECYRISGLVPSQLPRQVKKTFNAGGFDIPKGCYVSINSGWLAMSPDVWGDPDAFRPERFINEAGVYDTTLETKLSTFGSGRRICVAEQLARTELFIISTHVLHHFTLRLPEGTPITLEGSDGLAFQPLPYEIEVLPRSV